MDLTRLEVVLMLLVVNLAYMGEARPIASRTPAEYAPSSQGIKTVVQEVSSIIVDNGQAKGVRLACGKEIHATTVMSNTTPRVTFEKLLNKVDYFASFVGAPSF